MNTVLCRQKRNKFQQLRLQSHVSYILLDTFSVCFATLLRFETGFLSFLVLRETCDFVDRLVVLFFKSPAGFKWVFMCVCKCPALMNVFGQVLHLYGRSPVCVRMCFFKDELKLCNEK